MHTFVFTAHQLELAQDLNCAGRIHIIHILLDEYDSYTDSTQWQDRYITLIDCDDSWATYLHLI